MNSLDVILTLLLIPVYVVIATELNVDSGVPQQSVEAFVSTVTTIGRTIFHSWEETIIYPQLAETFLTTSKSFPDRNQFEQFCAGNDHWNKKGTIYQIQWVPSVHNTDRAQFESDMKLQVPGFSIFSFLSSEKFQKPQNSSEVYFPILYCSPLNNPGILGLDLNDDVEGPAIRASMSTGVPATADPFEGRGPPPQGYVWNSRKMMGLYMPLFISKLTFTKTRTSVFAGAIVTIIAFGRSRRISMVEKHTPSFRILSLNQYVQNRISQQPTQACSNRAI
jgi:CHASE1-domain containing sensor protein